MQKYIKLFEDYHKENEDSTIIYRDNKLVIIVPTTYEATVKYSKDTNWCSLNKDAFEKHNITGNLFRFHFKDGYKLRLTWDYLAHDNHKDSFSGGTHWGCGGTKGGKKISYYHIRPKNEDKPFEFDYEKDDHRKEMVDYIKMIPKTAIDLVTKYQSDNKDKFNTIYKQLCSDINNIKIINIKGNKESAQLTYTINYKGKEYKLWGYYSNEDDIYKVSKYRIPEEMVIPYVASDFSPFQEYMNDKSKEYFKNNPITEALKLSDEIKKIKLDYKNRIDNCLVPLSDLYEMSYRDRILAGKTTDDTYRYSFKLYNTSYDEVVEALDRSLDRLKHELDAEVGMWVQMYSIGRNGDRDSSVIGSQRTILKNRIVIKSELKQIEKYGITDYYIKLDLYIS